MTYNDIIELRRLNKAREAALEWAHHVANIAARGGAYAASLSAAKSTFKTFVDQERSKFDDLAKSDQVADARIGYERLVAMIQTILAIGMFGMPNDELRDTVRKETRGQQALAAQRARKKKSLLEVQSRRDQIDKICRRRGWKYGQHNLAKKVHTELLKFPHFASLSLRTIYDDLKALADEHNSQQ